MIQGIRGTLGSIQIIGACFIIYAFYFRLSLHEYNVLLMTIPLVILTLFSILAGIYILKGTRRGYNWSIINFSLQTFQFSYFGLYFYYFLGPYVGVGYIKALGEDLDFWLRFKLFTGTLIVNINTNPSSHFFVVNLIAILLLVTTIYLRGLENNKLK